MTDTRTWLAHPRHHMYTDQARMADALLAVLNLHREDVTRDEYRYCVECDARWPCPTVRVINEALNTGED